MLRSAEKIGTGELLRQDHERIDRIFTALLDACHEDDREEVRAAWDAFETGLRAHMNAEEAAVFPGLARAHKGETEALIAEHDDLRRLLAELGVSVDLHLIREDVARRLIARVREHARRENELAYAWSDRELPRAGSLEELGAPPKPGAPEEHAAP